MDAGRLKPLIRSREEGKVDIVQYVFLLIAVASEVCGTWLLPVSQNFTRPAPTLSLIGLRSLFLLFDPRPEYAADRGGLRHVVRAGDFSHHPAWIPCF